jgi:hypothetical protein
MNRANRKALRTLAQLVVSAGFTAAVAIIVQGLTAAQAGAVLAVSAVSQLVVTWGQNYLEAKDVLPEFLPPKPAEVATANERYVAARLRTDPGNRRYRRP